MSSTIKHSIIIPHSGRDKNLALCLESIRQSAAATQTDVATFEVIVVGDASWQTLPDGLPVAIHVASPSPKMPLRKSEPPPFWKTHLLNRGIEASSGDILTFLDADALVGPEFLLQQELYLDSSLTYLSYRVRKIDYDVAASAMAIGSLPNLFSCYNSCVGIDGTLDMYPRAFEAYGNIENGFTRVPDDPVYGNSQFSIRRAVLGDLRWDERYFGRGFEDLDMLRRLHGIPNCRAEVVTYPEGAMFHVKHEYSPGFNNDRWADRNQRMFHGAVTTWIVSSRHQRLDDYKSLLCNGTVPAPSDRLLRYRLHGDFDVQEMLPNDTVLNIDTDGNNTSIANTNGDLS